MLISNQPHLLATQEFINGCNIQSEAARKQLFDWSTGIYTLGLWNSMVCWPLRSSQNAGVEDKVFSLGVLGRSHATLVNIPTRGADGIALNGTNQYINSNFIPPMNDNCYYFTVARRTGGAYGDVIASGNNEQFIFTPRTDGGGVVGVFDTTFRGSTNADTSTSFTARSLFKNSTNGTKGYLNTTQYVNLSYSAPFNTAATPLLFGARNLAAPGIFLTGDISFVMAIRDITADEAFNTAIYNLYKNTIGQGLSLP